MASWFGKAEIAALEQRVAEQDRRIEQLVNELRAAEQRAREQHATFKVHLDGLVERSDQRQGRVNTRLDRLETNLGGHSDRISAVEDLPGRLQELASTLERHDQSLADIDEQRETVVAIQIALTRLQEETRFEAEEALKRSTALLQRIELNGRSPAREKPRAGSTAVKL